LQRSEKVATLAEVVNAVVVVSAAGHADCRHRRERTPTMDGER